MAKITIKKNLCKGCELCATACNKKLLALSKDGINEKGYHPIEIERPEDCISCAMCAMMCPDLCIEVEK